MIGRLGLELALAALAVIAVLVVLLIGGQLAQVGQILFFAGGVDRWWAVMQLGGLILLEAALPLAALVASGLVYGRGRSERQWMAHAALGHHPGRAWLPAVALGVLLGGLAGWLAGGPVPRAVTALRGVMVDAVGAALVAPGRAQPLPGGGVSLRASADEGGALWAALPGADAAEPPTLLRAGAVEIDRGDAGPTLVLRDVQMWSPITRLHVGQARLHVDSGRWVRRLRMFGPPNALPSSRLDLTDRHHRFTAHRRWALPAMGPLWALLGALLGARLGGPRAVLAGAGAVGLAYGLLRTGELSARAGFMSPALAAWAPALVLALALALTLYRDPSLVRRAR